MYLELISKPIPLQNNTLASGQPGCNLLVKLDNQWLKEWYALLPPGYIEYIEELGVSGNHG